MASCYVLERKAKLAVEVKLPQMGRVIQMKLVHSKVGTHAHEHECACICTIMSACAVTCLN